MKLFLYFSFLIAHFSFSVSAFGTTRPWTFWYWMYGAVSEEGIKADLLAMKDVGLGGCYLMPIRGTADRPEYKGQAEQLSVNFWKMVDYALGQANTLGLEMGIHISDGFALAGGPWITAEESMQKVVFCDTVVTGGHHTFFMPRPKHYDNYYEDIALYAIPLHDSYRKPHLIQKRPLTSKNVTINDKGVLCADDPCWLQYEFDKSTLIRNIEIVPSGNNIQSQRLLVKASDDGVIFYKVKQLVPPRQGWQNSDYTSTFSIPPTTAKYFRFEWTPEGTEPGAEDLDAAKWKPVLRLKDIRFSSFPLIDNWEGKGGYVWRLAEETADEDVPIEDFLRPEDILVFPPPTGNRGGHNIGDIIDVDLPQGPWRILRMGHTSTGHTNATGGGAKGLECDKFSRRAVEKQIDHWFGLFMKRPNHHLIKYMHVDSWECGSQNWSQNFAQEFERRRGYDILPLLPVYAGVPMSGGEETLRDIRRTINELVNEVFFVTVAQKAKEYGVLLSSESVAPTMVSDGMEHYKYVDLPMGEFWLNSPTHDKPNDMLDAISGAHVYGKNIIQAEAFTEVRGVWDETPAMVKPLLDRYFALGMNRLFFHVNTHNPWMNKKPGMTLDGIGLFFQRDQTWFPEAKAFVDYITRCQTLLQQGTPVVDIAVYTGEEIPCRALTPDRVVAMLPGLFGTERVASEQRRLANLGQPMEESPVGVRHSAGILDLKDWINPLHGYQYDSMNKDALLNRPFNYSVLVIPDNCLLSREVTAKIEELRRQSIIIIEKPYTEETFEAIERDADLPEGIAYTHRSLGSKDIYFLSNQQDKERSFTASFRSGGRTPTLYDPMTDETFLPSYTKSSHRTNVKLTLPAYGSTFVVFGHATSSPVPVMASTTTLPVTAWNITFRESNITLENQQLFDWSQHADNRIRYFSGHACYSATFKLKEKEMSDGRVWLSFPEVKDIAHVWVNGKDCGIAWTAPYQVEVTEALKKGKNTIEIEVVNTWHNALRGADQGKVPYEGIWTNAKYRTKGDALLPAGLLEQPIIRITTN
jgi:hypothetical protein